MKWRSGLLVLALLPPLAIGQGPERIGLEILEPPTESPETDGWTTEVWQNAASSQLKKLAKLLAASDPVSEEDVRPFLDDRLEATPLLTALSLQFEDAGLRVERQTAPTASAARQSPSGLAGALAGIQGLFTGDAHPAVKIVRVRPQPDDTRFETDVLIHLDGTTTEGHGEASFHWSVGWQLREGKPLIRRIDSSDFEWVTAPRLFFEDDTTTVLSEAGQAARQLAVGVDRWWGSLDASLGVDPNGYQGLSLGDVDGDGREDLYVSQSGGLPNLLLLQTESGRLRDATHESGAAWMDRSRGALLVDLDGDGDRDLALATAPALLLMRNDGAGHFELVEARDDVTDGFSLAAADYDGDGRLDLYVCRYYGDDHSGALPLAVPYHDAENGGANVLLANEGGLRFRDATREAGLHHRNFKFSFAASWSDYDSDGDPDLYVANDFGRNNLYRNDDGRFTDVAAEAGVEDIAAGMSASWSDYDRDGLMDLYVGNMFSSAGGRITFQQQFKPDAPDATRRQYQRHARGNSLFRNLGDGRFEDVTEEAAVWMGRWAWSSPWVDVNNDGRDDLVVGNGYITNEDTKDL